MPVQGHIWPQQHIQLLPHAASIDCPISAQGTWKFPMMKEQKKMQDDCLSHTFPSNSGKLIWRWRGEVLVGRRVFHPATSSLPTCPQGNSFLSQIVWPCLWLLWQQGWLVLLPVPDRRVYPCVYQGLGKPGRTLLLFYLLFLRLSFTYVVLLNTEVAVVIIYSCQ